MKIHKPRISLFMMNIFPEIFGINFQTQDKLNDIQVSIGSAVL